MKHSSVGAVLVLFIKVKKYLDARRLLFIFSFYMGISYGISIIPSKVHDCVPNQRGLVS